METDAFEELVRDAIDTLPGEFLALMENVEIVVQRWPTRRQLASVGLRSRHNLLGLYEGTPRTERGADYGFALPDRITLFQHPIESICSSLDDIRQEIQDTVVHELGHHFGIDEARMEALEAERDARRRASKK